MTIQIVKSVTGSVVFFILFSLAVSFWGKLLLRLVIKRDIFSYGSPLPIIACLSILALISRYIHYITQSFEKLYIILFIIGAIGVIIQISIYIINIYKIYNKDNDKNKDKYNDNVKFNYKNNFINCLIINNSLMFVGIFICAVYSTYFSLLWPSGTLEPWLSINVDYFNWILLAEYWRGHIDLSLLSVADINKWIFDSFGTHVIFGFFAAVKGGPTYLSAPYFIVTIISWIGICVYKLVREIFDLPIILVLFITLSLLFGNFFNFISLNGQFGHLVALFGFLTCLDIIFSENRKNSDIEDYVKLFFAILFLFVCYQAVFIVFITMVFLADFLLKLFNCLAIDKGKSVKELCVIIFKSFKKTFFVLIIPITCVSLLAPQVAYQISRRIFTAINQVLGFRLKLIEPVFFSGIPVYNDSLVTHTTDSTYLSYMVYIIFLIILSLYVISKHNTYITLNLKVKIKVMIMLLLYSIATYLIFYKNKGDLYIVWKYSTYSILPLSFVASSLLFSTIFRLIHGKLLPFSLISCIIAFFLILPPVIAVKAPFYGNMGKNTQNKSLIPFIALVKQANNYNKEKTKLVLDFTSIGHNLAAVLATLPYKKEIYIIDGVYLFKKNQYYFPILDSNTVIYTDKLFDSLYKSYRIPNDIFTLYNYYYENLIKQGAVAYVGLKPYATFPEQNTITVSILVPIEMKGDDLNVIVELPFFQTDELSRCEKIKVKYLDLRDVSNSDYHDGFFEAKIPKEEQHDGIISLVFYLPGINMDKYNPRIDKDIQFDCDFRFKGVTLVSVE
jgi:hypothetical protein